MSTTLVQPTTSSISKSRKSVTPNTGLQKANSRPREKEIWRDDIKRGLFRSAQSISPVEKRNWWEYNDI